MQKAARSPDLKKAFEKHARETEGQVKRLEQVFAIIDKRPKAKTCDAIMGIMKEGQEIMDEYKGSPTWLEPGGEGRHAPSLAFHGECLRAMLGRILDWKWGRQCPGET